MFDRVCGRSPDMVACLIGVFGRSERTRKELCTELFAFRSTKTVLAGESKMGTKSTVVE